MRAKRFYRKERREHTENCFFNHGWNRMGTEFTENGGSIELASRDGGNELIISVKDTGIGIKPEIQKMLFDKTAGYTTRGTANEKGTGLGLILCKEFVEKNGGRIWLESELGTGSTFYFTIKKG